MEGKSISSEQALEVIAALIGPRPDTADCTSKVELIENNAVSTTSHIGIAIEFLCIQEGNHTEFEAAKRYVLHIGDGTRKARGRQLDLYDQSAVELKAVESLHSLPLAKKLLIDFGYWN